MEFELQSLKASMKSKKLELQHLENKSATGMIEY